MNYISEKFNIHFLPEYTLSAKAGFSKDVIADITAKEMVEFAVIGKEAAGVCEVRS